MFDLLFVIDSFHSLLPAQWLGLIDRGDRGRKCLGGEGTGMRANVGRPWLHEQFETASVAREQGPAGFLEPGFVTRHDCHESVSRVASAPDAIFTLVGAARFFN
jgi:hypothetical protein